MATNIQQHGRLSNATVTPVSNLKSGTIFIYGTTKLLGVSETNYYTTTVQGTASYEGTNMALNCAVSVGITTGQTALALGAEAKFNFTTQLLDNTVSNSVIGTVIGYDGINNLYLIKMFEYLNGVPTIT